jgi:hypothetical protein
MVSFLEEVIDYIIKRWEEKQFRKKILAYKQKLNEKRKGI